MGAYDPKRCCCCFSMRTGILFLGSVSLIYAIINLLNTPYLFELSPGVLDTLTEDWPPRYEAHKENIVFFAIISNEVMNAFLLLVSCLLIHGIRKDRPSLLIPYMVWTVTFVILTFVGIVLLAFIVITVQPSEILSGIIVALTVFTCLQIYNVVCINAYYKQIEHLQYSIYLSQTTYDSVDSNDYQQKYKTLED